MKREDIFRMLFLMGVWIIGLSTYAQESRKVSGQVTDNANEPIPGVNIVIKGTSTGTITDYEGQFQLQVPNASQAILIFRYIGFNEQEIAVGNQSMINVSMESSSIGLDEVVAIGYGTVRKRDLTGAVSSIKPEDITVSPTNNVMEALQGKVSGMDIMKTSGQIGSDVEIYLRGSRSIYGDNSPLFIIDGVPGSYNQINPSDIKSIDVLKDASSTAIYGSSGANGVVIITTKRGSEGKAIVNFDAHYGFSGTPKFLHGMIGEEWTAYQRESYKYANGDYPSSMSSILTDAKMLESYNNNQWIDWVEEVSGNAATMEKYNFSITGGTKKTKIYSGVNYTNEKGLLSNENLDRYAIRVNIDQEINHWANAGFTSNINYSEKDQGVKNTFTKALSSFPLGRAYDDSGDIIHEYANGEYSPLGDFIKDQFVYNTKSIYANAIAFLEITPIKDLSLKSMVNGTLNNGRIGQYWGEQSNANRPSYAGTPHASISNNNSYNYTWENILSYHKTINNTHNVSATLVSSYSESINESSMASGSGQELDSWTFHRLASATSQHIESDYAKSQKMSYAGRLNYSYKEKYLLTLSNRWDGVSWLSEGNKWDFFPAGAFAWRISEESFMEGTKDWLPSLKLRIGYGKTGNAGGISAYSTQTNVYAYTANGITVNGKVVPFTQYTGTYGNPSLGWEKSYNMNIGIDFALLHGRIDGAIEYYNTKTTDLLFKRTMPITSGVTGWGSPLASWENIAETSNKGVEVTINSTNVHTNNFRWNSTLSLAWNKEEIVKLPSGDLISESLFEGYPIRSLYNYKYAGIWGTNASQEELDAYGVKPGWVKIETVDNEGDDGVHRYSQDDKQILGHENPNFIAGLNNTFSYRNFDLSVFVMGRFGQTIKSDLIGWYNAKQGATTNQPSGIDYWTESNQNAYFPVPGSGSQQSEYLAAYTYQDGSFIKLKNITLGYTLPVNLSRRALMDRCRVFATAYNPLIWVKSRQLKDTDPETNGSDSFPLYKQFVLGINVTF
ncbi:MAG TPA: TonB-dependent receptor [Mariniphaga sp.]|nr:TonB-dependent receptor [Mariniphaga sp.]